MAWGVPTAFSQDFWQQTNGPYGGNVSCLAINSSGDIFAGTNGGGVFRSVESTTSVEEIDGMIPSSFALHQNYPNPFNPSTRITYTIPRSDFITLKVYDILGREIKTIVSEFQKAGNYSFHFDASKLSSGVYFYSLQAGDFDETKKMVLIR